MRRLTVECPDGHLEEILIGMNDHIPICQILVRRETEYSKSELKRYEAQGQDMETYKGMVKVYVGPCRRRRQIVWGIEKIKGHISKAAPSFRVAGATKKF